MSVPDGAVEDDAFMAGHCHSLPVIARLDRAIEYSRESSGLRRGWGVLDSPLSRGM